MIDKETLRAYRANAAEVKQLSELVERCRACYTDEKLQQIQDAIQQRDRDAELIETAIMALPDPQERLVLRGRYLMGWTWQRVADACGYSLRSVHRVHGRALEHIKEVEV